MKKQNSGERTPELSEIPRLVPLLEVSGVRPVAV